MKKIIIIIGILFLLIVAVPFVFHLGDDDCDRAFRKVEERVEFRQLPNEIGRSDGIGIRWSFFGCTISDDFDSWFVTWWGAMKKK